MNNENNNLNGVVLGNVTNQNDQVVNPVNTGNGLVQPEPVANTTSSALGNEVVMPGNNVMPNTQSQIVEPVVQPVTNNVPSVDSQVVNPIPNNPVNNMQPSPVNGQNVTNGVNSTNSQVGEQSAFTSINAIEQNAQNQNFEKSIGTNPPISLEKDKQPKKKGNKFLFIIIVILLIAAVFMGTYYVLNYTDLLTKKDSITINTNNITINLGDALSNNISDYASINGTNSTNCSLDTSKVDITKVGIYKYTVTCSNKTKEGNVVIVDDKPINIETKTVYAAFGESVEAKDFVKKIDSNLTYEFVNKDEIDSLLNGEDGSYTIKIKAVSASGKEAEADAKLVKIQYKIKGYLVCKSPNQNNNNYIMNTINRFAIVDDGNNGFGNVTYESYSFKYTSEADYAQIVSDYSANGTLNINNVTGDVELNDSNLTVLISNEIDSNSLKEKYGADNFATYSTIRTYYVNTLGYECGYEKAND